MSKNESLPSSLEWFPVYHQKIRASTRYASLCKIERGCFWDMALACWQNACSSGLCVLPSDKSKMYRIVQCFTDEERSAADTVLDLYYEPYEGNESYMHEVTLSQIWLVQLDKYHKAVRAAEERWKRHREQNSKPERISGVASLHANHPSRKIHKRSKQK